MRTVVTQQARKGTEPMNTAEQVTDFKLEKIADAAEIVYHGTNHVPAHTTEKQPVDGQAPHTFCSTCGDWFKPVPYQMVKVQDLVTAVEKYIQALFEDCEGFSCPVTWDKNQRQEIPERFRWLIAFAVEGESEADYVHFGALVQKQTSWSRPVDVWGDYVDFGFTKVWGGSARAREIAAEVQRFLNAARWN